MGPKLKPKELRPDPLKEFERKMEMVEQLNDYLDSCVEYIGPFPYKVVKENLKSGSKEILYFPTKEMAEFYREEDSAMSGVVYLYTYIVFNKSKGSSIFLP